MGALKLGLKIRPEMHQMIITMAAMDLLVSVPLTKPKLKISLFSPPNSIKQICASPLIYLPMYRKQFMESGRGGGEIIDVQITINICCCCIYGTFGLPHRITLESYISIC